MDNRPKMSVEKIDDDFFRFYTLLQFVEMYKCVVTIRKQKEVRICLFRQVSIKEWTKDGRKWIYELKHEGKKYKSKKYLTKKEAMKICG